MSPIQFGIVMTVNLAIGFITPPLWMQSVLRICDLKCIGGRYCEKDTADDWSYADRSHGADIYTGAFHRNLRFSVRS